MDERQRIAAMLMGKDQSAPLSGKILSQALLPPQQQGQEYGVRMRLPGSPESDQAMQMEFGRQAMPDSGKPFAERFQGGPRDNLELAANIFGGPSLRGVRLPTMRLSDPERIAAAAIRVGDEVVRGTTHSSAWANAQDRGMNLSNLNPADLDGFVTSTGRYVSRQEAAAIADRAQQVRNPGDPGEGGLETSKMQYGWNSPPQESAGIRDSLIDILKRYGLMGATAAPPSAALANALSEDRQ